VCNANHHFIGCKCGWGEGESTGIPTERPARLRSRTRDPERIARWRDMFWCELAAGLGHSILFPVSCQCCGSLISVYADPDGTFEVYDRLGPAWPAHRCFGMGGRSRDFRIPAVAYSALYDMPVPLSIERGEYSIGRALCGSVVLVRTADQPRSAEPYFHVALYDGLHLYAICVRQEPQNGIHLRGTPRRRPGGVAFLEGAEQVDPFPNR
jgi:hypothetical protein